jgi:hypothetical protein
MTRKSDTKATSTTMKTAITGSFKK